MLTLWCILARTTLLGGSNSNDRHALQYRDPSSSDDSTLSYPRRNPFQVGLEILGKAQTDDVVETNTEVQKEVITMGRPVCCGRLMRVGVTSKDGKTQLIYCTKCQRTIRKDTAREEKAA